MPTGRASASRRCRWTEPAKAHGIIVANVEEVKARGSTRGSCSNFPFLWILSLETLGRRWWHKPHTDHIPASDKVCVGEFLGCAGDSWEAWVIKPKNPSDLPQAAARFQGQCLSPLCFTHPDRLSFQSDVKGQITESFWVSCSRFPSAV